MQKFPNKIKKQISDQINCQKQKERKNSLCNWQKMKVIKLIKLALKNPICWSSTKRTEKIVAFWIMMNCCCPNSWCS